MYIYIVLWLCRAFLAVLTVCLGVLTKMQFVKTCNSLDHRCTQGWRDIYQVIDIIDIYLISIWFLLSKISTLISWFLVLCETWVWQCYTLCCCPDGYWSMCSHTKLTFGFHSMSHLCTVNVTHGMWRTSLKAAGCGKRWKFRFCCRSLGQIIRYLNVDWLNLTSSKVKSNFCGSV